MKTRDARKWEPLCEAEGDDVYMLPNPNCNGDCFWMLAAAGPGWRITVDPDGVAWTWSTEE